jgi:hypothetical protein
MELSIDWLVCMINLLTEPADKSASTVEDGAAAMAEGNLKLMGSLMQKVESTKMKSIFKICPTSAGDARRPSISDFTVGELCVCL